MITSPTFPEPPSAPDFVRVIAGVRVRGTVAVSVSWTGPVGAVPFTVAVFATAPASTSACVRARVAVAVTDCPGCSVPAVPLGHGPYESAERPVRGSLIETPVSVVLPVLPAVNL